MVHEGRILSALSGDLSAECFQSHLQRVRNQSEGVVRPGLTFSSTPIVLPKPHNPSPRQKESPPPHNLLSRSSVLHQLQLNGSLVSGVSQHGTATVRWIGPSIADTPRRFSTQMTVETGCSTRPVMPNAIPAHPSCRPMNYGGESNGGLNLFKFPR